MGGQRRIALSKRPPLWTPFVEVTADMLAGGKLYVNSRYQVVKRHCGTEECGTLWHLSIKNRANNAEHDWRDYQRIKNELIGPEAEGVELYPAESRLVDSANQFHLWIIDGPGFQFPFGFADRLVCGKPIDGGAQRPFDE
jgi:hypothetical protein